MSVKTILNPFTGTLQKIVDESKITTEEQADNIEQNVILNAFRIAILGSFTVLNMVDGIVDNYIDQTGIDTGASSGQLYDSGNNLYSPLTDLGTVLLLHLNGSDGDTSTTDSSPSAHGVTFVGDVELDTAQTKFGNSSLLLDGTGDYLSIPDSEEFNFGNGDFTVEAQIRLSVDVTGTIMSQYRNAGLDPASFALTYNAGASKIFFSYFYDSHVSGLHEAVWNPNIDQWYHIAVSRDGVNLRIFIDGVELGSTHNIGTRTLENSAVPLLVGIWNDIGIVDGWNGWIDEVRITKGSGVYTGNFTPPVAEFSLVTENMTLISESFEAQAQPDASAIQLVMEDIDAITINTDFFVEISRDGGTTFTNIVLEEQENFIDSQRVLTGSEDISAQPSGTDMVYKIITDNNKKLKVHVTSLTWD